MNWRVIKSGFFDAARNMALDEAIAESVSKGLSPPTIRFFRWEPNAVSVGYFQSLAREVDLDVCKSRGVDVVRRRTGGGAVYHDKEGELTYSVIAPDALFPKGITESYHEICGSLIAGLKEIGVEGAFRPINDVTVADRKISGNAQTRRWGVLWQHGTVLHDVDVDAMFSLLRVPDQKMRDKLVSAVKESVTRVKDHSGASMAELEEALTKGFTRDREWSFGEFTQTERERAAQIEKERYRSDAWTHLR